jgi:hypothetical protein
MTDPALETDAAPAPRGRSTRILPESVWAVIAIVVWALAITTLIDRGPFGLDEASARAILFLWSVSDQVASPIVALGVPDFRAVYLIPAGVPFSGSLLAVKLCTLFVLLTAAIAIFRWRRRTGDAESPPIACALLLLCPLSAAAIDRVDIGPFLLLTFVLGAWADDAYRTGGIRFGGMYFGQLILCLSACTLHPAGLALPIVLARSWIIRQPAEDQPAGLIPGRERTHVLTGIALATLIGCLLAAAWHLRDWIGNPVTALAAFIFSLSTDSGAPAALAWTLGSVLLLALVATVWRLRASLGEDRLFATIALGATIAAPSGDLSFALLALSLLLFWGFALLLRVHVPGAGGFIGQRGVAFALLIVVSTAFLSSDRARFERIRSGPELSAQDQLIDGLAQAVHQGEAHAGVGPRVASQWPGRTMIACRCSALPLPPAIEDEQRFLANLRGIDYVVFDPKAPENAALSRAFAILGGGRAETVVLQSAGVVLRLHGAQEPAPAPPLPSGPGGIIRG